MLDIYLGHWFKIIFELFHAMSLRPVFQNKIMIDWLIDWLIDMGQKNWLFIGR